MSETLRERLGRFEGRKDMRGFTVDEYDEIVGALREALDGFTRGDVLFLREIGLDHEARRYVNTEEAEDLADCIEALLPPEAG